MSHKTYLITAAVAGAEPNWRFLTCLAAYAKHRDAEVLVATLPGLHKNDVVDVRIAADFGATLVDTSLSLGRNLSLLQFRLRPAQQNPLVSLSRFIQNKKSAIIPSTKQFFQPVATMTSDPRVFYTTGACTEPAYADSRIGEIATFDHVIGAVVVECGHDGLFHARPLRWKKGTCFTDIGSQVSYFGKGAVQFKQVQAKVVTLGDWHTGDTDPVARSASFDMLHQFEPRTTVVHDIFNGHSINHHEQDKCITRAREHRNGRLDLPAELLECAKELEEISRWIPARGRLLVSKSNHDDWLARYLESGHYNDDPQNYRLALTLAAALYDGQDPLEAAVRSMAKLPHVSFLHRKHGINILGWEVGEHGDAGVNGSKGNTAQLERVAGHAVIGHQHTPSIFRGLVVVGTNTKLQLGYNEKSPSTWLHANSVIWPDGSCQLLVMPEQRACKWTYFT